MTGPKSPISIPSLLEKGLWNPRTSGLPNSRLTRVTWPHRSDNQGTIIDIDGVRCQPSFPVSHVLFHFLQLPPLFFAALQSETHHGLLMIFSVVLLFCALPFLRLPEDNVLANATPLALMPPSVSGPGNLLEFAKRIKYANKRCSTSMSA